MYRLIFFCCAVVGMPSTVVEELQKLGISVVGTLDYRKHLVLKVLLEDGREAVAYVPKPCLEDPGERGCLERSRDLEQEFLLVSRIRSEHVADFIDLVEVCGSKVLIREFARSTLRDLISARELDADRAVGVARDVALALVDVHRAGFVYTDLKPENIGIGGDGRALLIDFDSATPPFSRPRSITYSYAPPEYTRDGIVVYESDVYQLGLVLVEMLRNAEPLDEPAADQRLGSLVEQMLNPVPFLRPSPEAVARELGMLLGTG